MSRKSIVALVRCPSYEPRAVRQAVERGLTLLGGASRFVEPGESILLKPNLLVGRAPERAVTTHPEVFRAVADMLTDAGARLRYGDSPGVGRLGHVAERAGIAAIAEDLGIPPAEFSRGHRVSFPDGRLVKQFTLAAGVFEADGMVSLPKLKTHGLTRITGAVKNQFGCVPGVLKAEFHARLPSVDLFSRMLVDLNLLLRPRLFVMDAVVAMEGNGPQGGAPRPMNAILLSDDPVAVDVTACRMIDLAWSLVPPIVHGEAAGLGSTTPEIVGDEIEGFITSDFDANRSPLSTTGKPGRPSRWARRLIVPRPIVRAEACTRCGTCVEVCPVTPKAIRFDDAAHRTPPRHHDEACIRCYCCQEMCPEGAIDVRTPLLGRWIHRGS